MKKSNDHDIAHDPGWNRSVRELSRAALLQAGNDIDRGVHAYTAFVDSALPRLRDAIAWLYEEPNAASAAMPFTAVCETFGCDPDAIREKLTEKMPRGLQNVVFRGIRFHCPFIEGRECAQHAPNPKDAAP